MHSSERVEKRYRLAYQAPNYQIDHLELEFNLSEERTLVKSRFTIRRSSEAIDQSFLLHGSKALTLYSLKIDGHRQEQINWDSDHILLENLGDEHLIEIENSINPKQNSALEGLFLTDGLFCTDCEPEGFRSITFFADRPDIMATYRVTIIAGKEYKTLLSNGNLIESGSIDETQHYAIWEDPFPKPTYLFALVAGNLAHLEERHTRPDGSDVILRIYAKPHYIEQCHFALHALQRAMAWDEERYGLICDLDHYNIVAVTDFNGGAMENKGLNIFNSRYIFAHPEHATDEDFRWVDAVIAHEYFHNWTGNRITCQDWFNLALKEGLTVFREQEYIADQYHPGLKRIEDVTMLRREQFPEDRGPLAHPVRPDSVATIESLYTPTIYEKGAELFRLYQTILGRERFEKGLARYIERYDGQAVTLDHFHQIMQESANSPLPGFERWYTQAGTPHLECETFYDAPSKILRLSLKQRLPSTPDSASTHKEPHVIPIDYTLLASDGRELLSERFILTEFAQCLLFHNIEEKPIPIFLHNFSAPVEYSYPYEPEELCLIVHHGNDPFSTWDAAQNYYQYYLLGDYTLEEKIEAFIELISPLIDNPDDPHFVAHLLTPPTIAELLNKQGYDRRYNSVTLTEEYQKLKAGVAERLYHQWLALYQQYSADTAADRALKNIALDYLMATNNPDRLPIVQNAYLNSSNMTDRMAALSIAVRYNHPEKETLLQNFIQRYKTDPNVIDRWFSLQAQSEKITLEEIKALTETPYFNYQNPNRVRSLFVAVGRNLPLLERESNTLFQWLLESIVTVDRINPQTASALTTPFSRLDLLSPMAQDDALEALTEILKNHADSLSTNLRAKLEPIMELHQ